MRIDRTLPSAIIAKDGSAAIDLLDFDGKDKVPNKPAQGYYYHFRLVGEEAPRYLGVRFSYTVLSITPENFGLSASFYRETDFRLFAEAAIGEYLDEHGAPPADMDPERAIEIDCFSPQFEAWRYRPTASDEEVCDYIRNRLRWSWRFGHAVEEFSSADYLRLRIKPADFLRISQMFSGDDWELVETDGGFVNLKPTKQLLRSAKSASSPISPARHVASVESAQQMEEGSSVPFVDPARIGEMRAITTEQFDLRKLIALCEEMNIAYRSQCYLSVVMLTRALLDHVPPIFGVANFAAVANNYAGTKSFKDSMVHLDRSARRIADAHLHTQIRKRESLPNRTQINFANDLDVLLAEIGRVLG